MSVTLNVANHIAHLRLDRPEKLNALNLDMLNALEAQLNTLDDYPDVRVVLLSAAGDKAFCVGADISVWSAIDPLDMWRQWTSIGHRIFGRLRNLRQPVIALLQGYTLGGGLELALAADIRYAAPACRLGLPEARLGTIPGWGGTQNLAAAIGLARAKELLFSAEQLDADTALQWGLINRIVAAEELEQAGYALATRISQNAPIAVQVVKQILNATEDTSHNPVLDALGSGLVAQTADVRKGTAAFLHKHDVTFDNS